MQAAVMVLNADLGPLHRVSLRHAIRMLCRGVAEIHEAEPDIRFGAWPRPTVVRLIQFIVTKWRYTAGPTWSRAGVVRRDGRTCGYCLSPEGHTIDHIRPVSRGGKNTWVNTVACCDPCNQRKGDRLPNEAGMTLKVKPYAPTWATLQR
jgi:5-methylcytosine-specific restriction endonuclease McrA